jgi:hypothetical protein
MSETETEGMYVDPDVWTEAEDTGDIDPGVWTEDDGSDTEPGDIVDPEMYPEADDSDSDGGLLDDLSGELDELLDTDESDSGILDGLDGLDGATDGQDWLTDQPDFEPIDQM